VEFAEPVHAQQSAEPPLMDRLPPAIPAGHNPRIETRPTVRLDPNDLKPSWPIVVASLEQLADWAVLALRLGTLALIQECVRDLAQREAKAEGVARLRQLVEALAHMPFDS
jgi:hypothetical protein